jgi:hypothetical protein
MDRYNEIKGIMDAFRKASSDMLNESSNDNQTYKEGEESIPYNIQDELMSSAVDTCKKQFGADFDGFETPMLYYPKDGDVVLSGQIGSLNNAKFQFRLKDPSGEGCFIWVNPMQMTDSNLRLIKVIYGVYKNWKTDLETAEDKKPIGLKQNDYAQDNQSSDEQPKFTPGDDY